MRKLITTTLLLVAIFQLSQAQFNQPPAIKATSTPVSSTIIKKVNTEYYAVTYASPELVRALNWWRMINPRDLSIYNSPYNLTTHTNGDTTYARFAAKTSLSFRGWYHPAGFPYWKADSMINLSVLVNLEQIDLHTVLVSNSSLKYLGKLPRLKAVYCSDGMANCDGVGIDADDIGLQALLQNRKLEYIGFKDLKRVTDDGFAAFSGMSYLKTLYINCWGITDKALLSLKGCTALETLYLIHTNITDEGLQNLVEIKASLPNLRTIFLNYSATTRKGEENFRAGWGTPINIIF